MGVKVCENVIAQMDVMFMVVVLLMGGVGLQEHFLEVSVQYIASRNPGPFFQTIKLPSRGTDNLYSAVDQATCWKHCTTVHDSWRGKVVEPPGSKDCWWTGSALEAWKVRWTRRFNWLLLDCGRGWWRKLEPMSRGRRSGQMGERPGRGKYSQPTRGVKTRKRVLEGHAPRGCFQLLVYTLSLSVSLSRLKDQSYSNGLR